MLRTAARSSGAIKLAATPLRPAEPRLGQNSRARGTSNANCAISFDLDAETLEEVYPGESWKNAYADVARFLRSRGFERQQGSVYFGGDGVDVVLCQNAVLELALEYDWFDPPSAISACCASRKTTI